VAHEVAVGWADREARRPMRADALFRIASQTKALTTVAAMQLVEEGRLGLVDPVSRYIPQFARTTVAVRTDTGRAIVRARRAITIRDLMTHTAGISYGTDALVAPLYQAQGHGPAAGFGWYTADKDQPQSATMERLASLPFMAQPGERFVYGYGTDVLGCVLERVTGKPLDQVIRERVTAPLGMRDSWFFVPSPEGARLTTVYASDSTGKAVRAPDGARGQGHYLAGPRRNFAGGAGLVSTARDYARFLEALRRDGQLDGVRLLAPQSVALMTSDHVDPRDTTDFAFGLGFQLVERLGTWGMRSVGSFGWGGAYGSSYWVDPRERMVVVFLQQLLPSRSDIQDRVVSLVYQALVN
jgi:CubicO group peptidase (beta-lactamase class C family)